LTLTHDQLRATIPLLADGDLRPCIGVVVHPGSSGVGSEQL
jgi:hypothetical protein